MQHFFEDGSHERKDVFNEKILLVDFVRFVSSVQGNSGFTWIFDMNEVNDILIVDEEIPSLLLLTELLEKEGYRIRPIKNAQLAIDSALAQPPNLILLDVHMTEMDGFEVCRSLKQDKRTHNVPIIFISSLQDTEARVQGFEAGGIDFITKPLQEQEVLARVRTHMDLYRMRKHQEQLVKEHTAELELEIIKHIETVKSLREQEAKLKDSEKRFRNLMEQSPLAMAIFTPDGQFTDVNPAWYRQWGLNREEATEVFARYNHRTDKQLEDLGVAPLVERAYTGESVVLPPIEYIGNRALDDMGVEGVEAKSCWIQIHLYPIKDENGSVACVVNTNVDITESKLAQERLLKSEQQFRGIMEQSPLAIALLTPQGQIFYVNSAWRRLWGVNKEEAAQIMEKYNFLTDKECEARGVMPLIQKAFAGESVVLPPIEYFGKNTLNDIGLDNANPNTVWLQPHIAPVKNENQEILFVVSANVDITERKKDEGKLIQAEQRYRTVADFTYDWEYWKSPDETLLYVSPSCERITGYKPEEFINNPEFFRELILPEDKTRWDEHHQKALKEKGLLETQFRIHKQDGQTRWIEHVCQPVTDEKGEFLGFRASNRDITERKKVEEDIARQAKLLDLIFKYSLDSIVLLDKDYNFIWVSETYAKSCQRDSSEFAGHNHFEFYPSSLKEEFDAVKKGKSIYRKYARPFIFPDHPEWGETYWDLGLVPILDDGGEIEMFLFTLKDVTERKRMESKLEESERKYRELVEDINDVIYSIDTKGNIAYISPAVKSIFGYEPHELMGKQISNFVHSDDLQAMKKGFESSLADRATPADYRALKKDGSYIWIRVLSNPIKDDNNNVIGIRGVVSDITKRKQAERQVREMASFAELNPAPVLRVNRNGIIMSCNPASVEILGKNAKKGTSINSLLTDFSKIDLNKCICENMLISQEVEIKGKFYLFILRGVSDLKLLHIYGSDITESMLAREKLLRSEQRFRSIMEQSPLPMAIYTPDGRIADVNPAFYREWGFSREEATEIFAKYNQRTDKQLEDIGAAPLVEKAYAGEAVVLPPMEYIGSRACEEFGVEGAEVRTRWIQIHLYPIKDENGSVAYVVNTNLDITERKQTEDQMNQIRSELLHATRTATMGELTAALAHELNHPLGSILNNANAARRYLAQEDPDLDEIRDIINDIISEDRRANEVMQKVRNLMKKTEVGLAPVKINSIIEEVLKLTHSELIIENVLLSKQLEKDLPQITGERIQLQQVFINLIMNAIDAMKESETRRIHISTIQHDADNLRVCISDTGKGFGDEEKANLFKPFFTTKKEGMGMGLSVTRTIIKSHGGVIWAQNNKDAGASFFITLPYYKDKSE